jgi:hypothetical protein
MGETLGYSPQLPVQDFHPAMVNKMLKSSDVWVTPKPQARRSSMAEVYRPKSSLERQIDYFDQNYREEDLPRQWWNINDVGFSMKAQMRLLAEVGDRKTWVNQVERDLRGFCLEYLKQGTVFPFEYEIVNGELVDRKYGRKMLATVDPKERGGAVFESLSLIQNYLIEGEDGATAVMINPPGDTGLLMDNGRRIVYEDTMTFHFQKKGNKVIGTTLRTDFDLIKAKELVEQLTGRKLPQWASAIDCVRAIAFRDGENNSSNITLQSLIDTLEAIQKSRFSYKEKTWSDMRRDIEDERRKELYKFDEKTGEIINEFKEYMLSGEHTELEIRKALAVPFLMLSKYFLVDKKVHYEETCMETYNPRHITRSRAITYGQIIEQVQQLPGCAGNGNKSSVTSITDRVVSLFGNETSLSSDTLCCTCPFCNKEVEAVISEGKISCPNCKKSATWSKPTGIN